MINTNNAPDAYAEFLDNIPDMPTTGGAESISTGSVASPAENQAPHPQVVTVSDKQDLINAIQTVIDATSVMYKDTPQDSILRTQGKLRVALGYAETIVSDKG